MKNMRKNLLISLILPFVFSLHNNAQNFSLLQLNKLSSEVNRVLQVFGKYSACQPGDSITELPTEYSDVFESDAWIENFLDPDVQNQKQLSPADYYRFIRSGFINGLNLKLHWNIGKMSKPLVADAAKVKYIVYLPFTINAIGLYNSQRIQNVNEEYYAIVGFRYENELISDVVILYIQANKPVMNYKYTGEHNLSVSLYGGPDFTRIYSRNIFTDDCWDAWGEWGYQAGVKVHYELLPNIGIYGGLGLSSYKSVYELRNFNNDSVYKQYQREDVDGDEYYELISASITETNSLSYLNVPLGVNCRIGKKKFHFTVQAGLGMSFLISSGYSASGQSEHRGYYPLYHVVLEDLPDYGFSDEQVDMNGDWDLNTFNLSANASIGLEMQLHENISLFAGPFIDSGLLDLGYKKSKHRDDYISVSGNPGKLSTFSAGLMFEIIYKL
jgi:hypothetical protein